MENFLKFQISFQINGQTPKNIQTNSKAWILMKVQWVIYQWICLYQLDKQMESFFQIIFELTIGRKQTFIWTNSKAWILIKVQWIWLDKLYKLSESFFQISESFFDLTKNFQNNIGVGYVHARWGGICVDQHTF